MKMRNLLFGVFLGLLAVVHSTPVLTLAAADVDKAAETEEYLADEFLLPFLTTESPKGNATVPATQQPMSESKESDMTEGSGGESMVPGGEHVATTTTLTSTTTVLPVDATRAPQSGVTSPSEPDEALSTDNDAIQDTTTMFILHGDELYESTTPSVPHAQSSTSTPFPMPSDNFNSHSSTTRALQSGVTSLSEPDEALSTDNDAIEDTMAMSTTTMFLLSDFTSASVPNDHNAAFQTTNPAFFSTDFMSDGSGSGDEQTVDLFSVRSTNTGSNMISATTAETSTASSTSKSGPLEDPIDAVVEEPVHTENKVQINTQPGSGSSEGPIDAMVVEPVHTENKVQKNTQPGLSDSPTNAGHSTPAWIIIVGFIVGVAALVMLCVAIATRDKWNGPRQASQAKANPSNQQRELEMETFMHKDNPRENGKAAEYTVIPLDELPEKYSSH